MLANRVVIQFVEKGLAGIKASLTGMTEAQTKFAQASSASSATQVANIKKVNAALVTQADRIKEIQKLQRNAAIYSTEQYSQQKLLNKEMASIGRSAVALAPGQFAGTGAIGSVTKLFNSYKSFSSALNATNLVGRTTSTTLKDMDQGITSVVGGLSRAEKGHMKLDFLASSAKNLSLHIRDVGKNAQWTGRQLMVGLTLPLVGAGTRAVQMFMSLNKEFTRANKVLGDSGWKEYGDGIKKASREASEHYGVSRTLAASIEADFAAMGYSGKQIQLLMKQVLNTAALGDVDIKPAQEFFRTIQKVFAEADVNAGGAGIKDFNKSLAFTTTLMDKFNQIENSTSIELKDMATAFPIVAQFAARFGLTAEQTAASLAAMHEKGIDASEAATSLKFSFASIVKPTRQAEDAFKAMGLNVNNLGDTGAEKLNNLAGILSNIHDKFGGDEEAKIASTLVGKRQAGRFLTLLDSIQQAKGQIQAVVAQAEKEGKPLGPDTMEALIKDAGIALPNAYTRALIASGEFYGKSIAQQKELAARLNDMSSKEVKIRLSSPEMQFMEMKQTFMNMFTDIGEALLPYVLSIGKHLEKLAQWFSKLPAPVLKMVAAFGILLAGLGPIIFVAGQLGTAFGEVVGIVLKLAPGIHTIERGMLTWAEELDVINGKYARVGDHFVELKGAAGKVLGPVKAETVATGELGAAVNSVTEAETIRGKIAEATSTKAVAGIQAEILALRERAAIGNLDLGTNPLSPVPLRPGGKDDVIAQLMERRGKGGSLAPGYKLEDLLGLHPDDFKALVTKLDMDETLKKEILDAVAHGDAAKQAELLGLNVVENVDYGMEKAVVKKQGKFSKLIGGIIGRIPVLNKLLGSTAAAGAAAGEGLAAAGEGAAVAGMGFGGWVAAIAAVVAAIIALPVILAAVTGNWDKFWKGFKPGLDGFLHQMHRVWASIQKFAKDIAKIFEPVIKTVEELFKALDGGSGKGGERAGKEAKGWEKVGNVYGGLLDQIGRGIAVVTQTIGWLLTGLAYIVRAVITVDAAFASWTGAIEGVKHAFDFLYDEIGLLASIVQGKWGDVVKYLMRAALSLAALMVWPFDAIERLIGKAIYNIIIKIQQLLRKIWVVGDRFADMLNGARDAMKEMSNDSGLGGMFSEMRNQISVSPLFDFADNPDNKKKADDAGKKVRNDVQKGAERKDPTGDAKVAKSIYEGFLNALKGNLDKQVGDLKSAIDDAFQKSVDTKLKRYDDQIKAIDALTAAEEKALKTEEYLQARREALQKRATDRENYRRNRALAVYEGRTNDARALDMSFNVTDRDNSKSIRDLDKNRARELLLAQRDAAKEKINVAKEAEQKILDEQKKAFDKQLELITQYTPKSVAEWQKMMDAINGMMQSYGVPAIHGSFDDALGTLVTATQKTKTDMENDAFWNGDFGSGLLLQWISKITGINVADLLPKETKDALGGGGAGDGSDNPDPGSNPKGKPKKRTKAEQRKDVKAMVRMGNAMFANKYPNLYSHMSSKQKDVAYLMDDVTAQQLEDKYVYVQNQFDHGIPNPKKNSQARRFLSSGLSNSEIFPGGRPPPAGANKKELNDAMYRLAYPFLWRHMDDKDRRGLTLGWVPADQAQELNDKWEQYEWSKKDHPFYFPLPPQMPNIHKPKKPKPAGADGKPVAAWHANPIMRTENRINGGQPVSGMTHAEEMTYHAGFKKQFPTLWDNMSKDERHLAHFIPIEDAWRAERQLNKDSGVVDVEKIVTRATRKINHNKPFKPGKGKDGKHGDGGGRSGGGKHTTPGSPKPKDKKVTVHQEVVHNVNHKYKEKNVRHKWYVWKGMRDKHKVQHHAQHDIHHAFRNFGHGDLKNKMDKIKEMIHNNVQDISDDMVKQFTDMANLVYAIFDGIRDNSHDVFDRMHQRMRDKMDNFKHTWRDAWERVKEVSGRNLDDIQNKLEKTLVSMNDMTKIAKNNIGESFAGIIDVFRGPLQWVITNAFNPFLYILMGLAQQVGADGGFHMLPNLSSGIPKFHSGGQVGDAGYIPGVLEPGERLIIAKKGEHVLTEDQAKSTRVAGGGPATTGDRWGLSGSIGPGATRSDFMGGFLNLLGAKITQANTDFMGAWMRAESGNNSPPGMARYNPLNTTNRAPGSTDFNSNNGYPVQNFKSFSDGLIQNVRAISQNAHGYPAIVAALRDGTDSMKTAHALAGSAWGTGSGVVRMLGGRYSGGGSGGGGGGGDMTMFNTMKELAINFGNAGKMILTAAGKSGDIAKGALTKGTDWVTSYMDKELAPKFQSMSSAVIGGPGRSLATSAGGNYEHVNGIPDHQLGRRYGWKGDTAPILMDYINNLGLPWKNLGAYNPGDTVASGRLSYHAFNRAVDFGDPEGKSDSPALNNIFNAFTKIEDRLMELIYANAPYNITGDPSSRKGLWEPGNHHGHVHAALKSGAMVKKTMGGITAKLGEGRYDEIVMPLPHGINEFANSFQAVNPNRMNGAYKAVAGASVGHGDTIIHETHEHHLHIANAIGERSWFDSNMKEWSEKTNAHSNKARGVTNRTVESYKSGNRRTVR